MSDIGKPITAIMADTAKTYTAMPRFRWWRPQGTTTNPDVLQQAWRCIEDGSLMWRPVELYVEPSA